MELDHYLRDHGHESYVVATRLEKQYPNVYQIGNRMEWNGHAVLSRLTGHQGYFSRITTSKMLRYLDSIQPDVVHLRNLRASAFNYPMLFRYLSQKRIPVVLTLHDCFMFTGRCVYYTVKECYQWENGCRKCPSEFQCERSWFFDFCRSLQNDKRKFFGSIAKLGVVGVSDWVTNESKRSFLGSASIIKRIYNWIDMDVFHPYEECENENYRKKIGVDHEFVILGIASGLSKEKGLDELLAVAEANKDAKVILVGIIPDGIEFPENVITLGEIKSKEELSRIYSMADVFVNPSPQETFGKTTAESLSCGTPVIGYDMTATSELLDDNRGILVNYNDKTEGFIRAVERFRITGKYHFSEACVEFARDNFDMQSNIEEYMRVYEELIERNQE